MATISERKQFDLGIVIATISKRKQLHDSAEASAGGDSNWEPWYGSNGAQQVEEIVLI